jgi:hypothetical protein
MALHFSVIYSQLSPCVIRTLGGYLRGKIITNSIALDIYIMFKGNFEIIKKYTGLFKDIMYSN